MGFLTRCKRPFLFAFLLQFCNMLFSFFLKTFLILFEKQHGVHKLRCKFEFHPVSRDSLRMGSSLVLPNARFPQQTGFRIRSRP